MADAGDVRLATPADELYALQRETLSGHRVEAGRGHVPG